MLRHLALALSVAAVTLLAGCGGARLIESVQRATMTEADVQAEGRELHRQIVEENGLYADPALAAYVERVGQRVARTAGGGDLIFRFFVLDDPDSNAFAVPGGYIYITRGELAMLNSEDELAVILGHEIAHVISGHVLKRNTEAGRAGVLSGLTSIGLSTLGMLTFNPLLLGLGGAADMAGMTVEAIYSSGQSREMELEADRLGVGYARSAGYAPKAALRALKAMQDEAAFDARIAEQRGLPPPESHGVFASHPDNAARTAALTAVVQAPAQPRAAEGDYLASLDGLAFGLSTRVGVQRGTRFFSRSHSLSLDVPAGWFSAQSPSDQAVLFGAPKGVAKIVLSVQDLATRQDASTFAKAYFSGAKLEGSVKTIAGRSTWRGQIVQGGLLGSGGSRYEVLAWTDAARGYALVGSNETGPKALAGWPSHFNRVAASIKPLAPPEVALAEAIRLRVVKADGGKQGGYSTLAKNAPLGVNAENILRLINGQYPGGEPAKGARVKVLR